MIKFIFEKLWFKKIFILTIANIAILHLSFAQNFNFNTLNTKNSKIPDNVIKTISNFSNDIWFATGDCFLGGVLVKYSQNKFYIFDTINHQLPDKFITSILPTSAKNIWIGTRYNGLWIFDGNKIWKKYQPKNKIEIDSHITIIKAGNQKDLWVGTTKGLVHVNNEFCNIYNTSNSKIPSNQINYIEKDWDNNIIVATDKGLIIIKKDSICDVYNSKNTPIYDDMVTHIAINKTRKEIWIAFWGGLACLRDSKWQIFDSKNSMLPAFAEYRPTCYNNMLWIATDQGLYFYDYNQWKTFNPNNSNIPDFFINKVIIDCKNNYWLATQNGLVKIENQK